MPALLDRLVPGTAAKLNLLLDFILILLALRFSGLTIESLAWASIAAACATWVGVATLIRHYDLAATRTDPVGEVKAIALLALSTATALGLSGLFERDAGTVVHAGVFGLTLGLASGMIRLTLVRSQYEREGPLEEVLIVGTAAKASRLKERLVKEGKRRPVGWLRFDDEPSEWASLGGSARLKEVLRERPVSEVYVAADVAAHRLECEVVTRTCEQLGVPFALPAHEMKLGRARLANGQLWPDGYLHFLEVKSEPHQVAMKRLFDVFAACLGILVLSPLLLLVALAIKVTSRGPVLFTQTRLGLHGRPFGMLKFRSMVMNAEALRAKLQAQNEQSGPVFKMANDPRVTRVGRFIRRYSIDELPQLLNIIKGEMSVVGPRPPLPKEVEQYRTWQLRRLSVRPGLTCVWQVSGRNSVGFEEWMKMDMHYIDHWSLREDFGLVLKTFGVVVKGRGAS
jgi:exopolysaccharide biosynthesis polyprenyl glycosylphosphotransferase